MEYFSRAVLDSWNGGLGMKQSPLLSCFCHSFQTARGIMGEFFYVCFYFTYLNFDTVHVHIEKKGNMEPILFILRFLTFIQKEHNVGTMFPDNRSTQPE